jgi:hypothetical protein
MEAGEPEFALLLQAAFGASFAQFHAVVGLAMPEAATHGAVEGVFGGKQPSKSNSITVFNRRSTLARSAVGFAYFSTPV